MVCQAFVNHAHNEEPVSEVPDAGAQSNVAENAWKALSMLLVANTPASAFHLTAGAPVHTSTPALRRADDPLCKSGNIHSLRVHRWHPEEALAEAKTDLEEAEARGCPSMLSHIGEKVIHRKINYQLIRKKAIQNSIKTKMEENELFFALSYGGLKGPECVRLRLMIEDATEGESCVGVFTNGNFRRAFKEMGYEATDDLEPLLVRKNMWIFAPEDRIKDTVECFGEFLKTLDDKERQEFHSIKFAVLNGKFVAGEDVKALTKMPTRKDLIASVARAVNAVPTNLANRIDQAANAPERWARGVKEVTQKMARGIKKAKAPDEE